MVDIKQVKLMELLPVSIRGDPRVQAAAAAIDSELQAVTAAIPETVLIARIDQLPETVLDLLAWQWHVDFYEPVGFSIDKKRAVIKQSIAWHRRKGTPWAVEQVVSTVFTRADIKEWWEYGGEPYQFIIQTEDSLPDEASYQLLRRAINTAKNTRSWLESIQISRDYVQPLFTGALTGTGGDRTILVARPDLQPEGTLHYGAADYLSGLAVILPSLPKDGSVEIRLGLLSNAKGGFQHILHDPDDLPSHDKIAATLGWPMAMALQQSVVLGVLASRPQKATLETQYHGAVEFLSGLARILPSLPKDGSADLPYGMVNAKGGFRSILFDSRDMPVHDKISASIGWPMAMAVQHSVVAHVQTARLQEATLRRLLNAPFGMVSGKGGYQHILFDPNDLPKHDKISAAMTWSLRVALQQRCVTHVKTARQQEATLENFRVGMAGYLSGLARILPRLPQDGSAALPCGVVHAKGGYRSILYDPKDMPTHDKISASLGWPMAVALQHSVRTDVRTARPEETARDKQAALPFGMAGGKGGYQHILHNPKDLPKHDKISARLTWTQGAAIRHSVLVDVNTARPSAKNMDKTLTQAIAVASGKGGFQRVLHNPKDLPKHDKISASMRTALGVALQRSGVMETGLARSTEVAMGWPMELALRQSNKVDVRTTRPQDGNSVLPCGQAIARGGYRRILHDPSDLPAQEKISASLGWPMALLVRRSITADVKTARPTEGNGLPAFAGAIVSRSGTYTIQMRR